VRGAEGIATVRPGGSSKSGWSEGSKNYIRTVALSKKLVMASGLGEMSADHRRSEASEGWTRLIGSGATAPY
jgi:hypothetical protein